MGAYKREHRGAFWDSFGRGKCAQGMGGDRECDGVLGWEIRWRLERFDRG